MDAIALLLAMIDQAYEKKSWHGSNLRGSIRGVSAQEAAWRPGPKRHGIADLVLHTAYWKYIVRRRLLGEERGAFPRKGSNWFSLPVPYSDARWKADVRLLDETHRSLRAAIANVRPKDLTYAPPGSKVSNAALLTGIAAHDLYHAGQIQYVKALLRK
jgi:uncharacterized damage-inducible protein DinB